MDCIILAGGFGTRLGSLTKKIPKPMLPINNLPFLEILIKKIVNTELIENILICTHYKSSIIENYFKSKNYPIRIIKEKSPLGTGGAIKKSLRYCLSQKILVLNGDTFVNIDLKKFIKKNKKLKKNTMLLIKKNKASRYGSILINKNKISFLKKNSKKKKNNINAGVYILKKNIFDTFKKKFFSFENFIASTITFKNWNFQISNSFFLDIGIKKDYFFAKKKLRKYE